jgi:hypothetical protein
VALSVDRTVGVSSDSPNDGASSTEITSVILNADHEISYLWSVSSRLGFEHVAYVDADESDNRWRAATALNYRIWRNMDLAFEYEYQYVNSGDPDGSFDKSLVTVGATYKY